MSEAQRRAEEQRKPRVIHGRIRKGWPTVASGGPLRSENAKTKGFFNPGVQCYRNSVLQCLLHVPEVFRYLDKADRCASPGDGCVFCALQALALRYWGSTDLGVPQQVVIDVNTALENHPRRNPTDGQRYGVLEPAWSVKRDLGVYHLDESGQQDEHEYLLGALNMLAHTNVNVIHDNARKVAIDRLFGLKCKRTWRCSDCGATHVREEEDTGIQLAIPLHGQQTRLKDCLREHFADETVERLECDSQACNNRKRNRIRTMKIVDGPEVLVIQLVRMHYSKGQMRKIMTPIQYGERLELSAFCGSPLKYQLNGVVTHSGPSLRQGHYIAAVRCQNGVNFALCNDSRVGTKLMESESYQSYLLVYQKIGGKMAQCI